MEELRKLQELSIVSKLTTGKYRVWCAFCSMCACAVDLCGAGDELRQTYAANGALVHAEIENHTGIAEKTLSEFVLALSKQCKGVKEFKKTLDANGAEFAESLVNTLWNIIQAMQVQHFAMAVARHQYVLILAFGRGDASV